MPFGLQILDFDENLGAHNFAMHVSNCLKITQSVVRKKLMTVSENSKIVDFSKFADVSTKSLYY